MPREDLRLISLTGLVLPDARTADAVDLGALSGRRVITAIRHRY